MVGHGECDGERKKYQSYRARVDVIEENNREKEGPENIGTVGEGTRFMGMQSGQEQDA